MKSYKAQSNVADQIAHENWLTLSAKKFFFFFAKKFLIQRNMINVILDYQTDPQTELKIITITSKNK